MNNIVRGALFFVAGAAVSSFITYKVVEKKYKKIADEEIESVRAVYERKLRKQEEENKVETVTIYTNDKPQFTITPPVIKEELDDYTKIVSDYKEKVIKVK